MPPTPSSTGLRIDRAAMALLMTVTLSIALIDQAERRGRNQRNDHRELPTIPEKTVETADRNKNEPVAKEQAKRQRPTATRLADEIVSAGKAERSIMNAAPKVRKELLCLALNIYHEARAESKADRKDMGVVTLNRLADERFPDTVCGVVDQPFQFSWTNATAGTARNPHPVEEREWKDAQLMAERLYLSEDRGRIGKRKFFAERRVAAKVPWMKKARDKLILGPFIYADVDKERPRTPKGDALPARFSTETGKGAERRRDQQGGNRT